MEVYNKLQDIVYRDPYLEGLKQFIEIAKIIEPEGIQFVEGEPNASDDKRVFSLVYHLPTLGDSIFLIIQPGHKRLNTYRFGEFLMGRYMIDIFVRDDNEFPQRVSTNRFHFADKSFLEKVGMRPQQCHPFPSKQYVGKEEGYVSIDILFADEDLLVNEEMVFPVYGNEKRIGSLYIGSKLYFDVQKINLGDVFQSFNLREGINLLCDG